MSYFTRPFFLLVETFWTVLPLVVLIDLLAVYLLIYKEKMDPRSFAFWIVIIIVFPFIGFALYLIYGCTLYSATIFGKKLGRDREMGLMDDPRIKGADVPTNGNSVEFYGDAVSGGRIREDILSAEKTIHLEIFRMDAYSNHMLLVDDLCAKASEGVDVRVLIGRGKLRNHSAVSRMKKSGVKVRTFYHRLMSMATTSLRFRNHRMLCAVDGRVAYSGEKSFVRLEGPAATRLEARFLADWSFATGSKADPVPILEGEGGSQVQVVSSGPDMGDSMDPATQLYVKLIKSAKSYIFMTESYLVPDENIYNFLKLAALSGVDVRVVVPRKGEHWYQYRNTVSASRSMFDSGVRIFVTPNRVQDNIVCVDGKLVGFYMAPFDRRAMLQDFYTSLIVDSEVVARDVTEYLSDVMDGSNERMEDDYRHQGPWARIKTMASRFMMLFN